MAWLFTLNELSTLTAVFFLFDRVFIYWEYMLYVSIVLNDFLDYRSVATSEAYLKPSQTSTTEPFYDNS